MILSEQQKSLAEKNGYHINVDNSGQIRSLANGNHVIWMVRDQLTLKAYFQTADIIDTYYVNHQKFNTLSEALNRHI